MKIHTVMFDFDGTLMSTNDLIIKSFQHTYRTLLGAEKPIEEITNNFGEPLNVTMKKQFGDMAEEAIHIYRSFHFDRFEELVEIFPGMDMVVKKLKKMGYKTALVTSRLRKTTLQGLEKYKLEEHFDHITTIDEIKNHKPDPESIYVTLEKLGVQPEEAIMIGDSRYDILCAKNAGCRSVLVDWSVMNQEERLTLKPDYIIKDAESLMELIVNQKE